MFVDMSYFYYYLIVNIIEIYKHAISFHFSRLFVFENPVLVIDSGYLVYKLRGRTALSITDSLLILLFVHSLRKNMFCGVKLVN